MKSAFVRWLVPLASLAAVGCAAPAEEEEVAHSSDDLSLGHFALCDVFGGCRATRAETWKTAPAAEHDFDKAGLDAATSFAGDHGGRCLLVVRDGVLVHESYRNGSDERTLHDTFSIAKTFTSALVGVAIQNGEIESPDDPAERYLPQWRGDGRHAPILLRHLLSGVSGLAYVPTLGGSVDFGDYTWLYTSFDLDAVALRHRVALAPDVEWKYHNRAVQVVGRVLRNATGENPEDYARTRLWAPIGMSLSSDRASSTHWRRDFVGNPVMFSSVYATCRGLAKFGQLLLQRGEWNEKQLIDRAYVDRMLAPSQDKNGTYGYLTWLNQPGGIGNTNEPFEGAPFPDAPSDLVSAQGVGQNFVDVLPSTKTVIVHIRPPNFLNVPEVLADGRQDLHRRVLASVLAADRRTVE